MMDIYCRIRLAGQQITAQAVGLGLIVFVLIGLIRESIGNASAESTVKMEGKTMRTKMKLLIGSVCNSIWTMGANLTAGALLA